MSVLGDLLDEELGQKKQTPSLGGLVDTELATALLGEPAPPTKLGTLIDSELAGDTKAVTQTKVATLPPPFISPPPAVGIPGIADPKNVTIGPQPTSKPGIGFKESVKRQFTRPAKGFQYAPISGGFMEAGEAAVYLSAAHRLQQPDYDYNIPIREEPTSVPGVLSAKPIKIFSSREEDQKAIGELFIRTQEEQERGFTFGGQVATGLLNLPTWMIEFALTGGLASLGDDLAQKAGEKLLRKYAKTKVGQTALKTAGWTGGAITRTSLGLTPKVIGKTGERQVKAQILGADQEGWATSFAKAWGDIVIESASETAGETLTSVPIKILNKTKFGKKFVDSLRSGWMTATGGKSGDFARQMLTTGGYSNIIGEYGEERLGNLLRALTDVDDFGAGKDASLTDRLKAVVKQDSKLRNIGVELTVLSVPMAGQVAAGAISPAEPGQKEQLAPVRPVEPLTPEPVPDRTQVAPIAQPVAEPSAEDIDVKEVMERFGYSEDRARRVVQARDKKRQEEQEVTGQPVKPVKKPQVEKQVEPKLQVEGQVEEKAKEVIDGVEYKQFVNEKGPAVRVYDAEAEEVVSITQYPDEVKAKEAFDKAVEKATKVATPEVATKLPPKITPAELIKAEEEGGFTIEELEDLTKMRPGTRKMFKEAGATDAEIDADIVGFQERLDKLKAIRDRATPPLQPQAKELQKAPLKDIDFYSRLIERETAKPVEKKPEKPSPSPVVTPTEAPKTPVVKKEPQTKKIEKQPFETSDLATSPNTPESRTKAEKETGGKYKLFFRGTTNEIFEGELFNSASEAKQFFKVQKLKAQKAQAKQPAKAKVKQLWEMTRDEFVKTVRGTATPLSKMPLHKTEVQNALSEGKPVPAKVLAEYPDLKQPTEKAKKVKTQKAKKKTALTSKAKAIKKAEEKKTVMGIRRDIAKSQNVPVEKAVIFRDMNIRSFEELVNNKNVDDAGTFPSNTFFANTSLLALGQKGNTGVLIEFSATNDLTQNLKISKAKPAHKLLAAQSLFELAGITNPKVMFDNIKSVTLSSSAAKSIAKPVKTLGKPVKSRFQKLLDNLEKQGWKKQVLKDGRVKYTKPDVVTSKSEVKAKPKRVISKEAFEKAKKRLTDRNKLNIGVDPQGMADLFTVGAYHFENGVRTFAAWSKKMVDSLGDWVEPHLESAWPLIQSMFETGKSAKEVAEQTTPKKKEVTQPISTANTAEEVDTAAKELLEETSARQADLAEDRDALGLEAMPSTERKAWQVSLQNAKDQNIPDRALRLATEINISARALNDEETAGLVIRATELKVEHKKAIRKIKDTTDKADIMMQSAEVGRIELEFNALTRALHISGTEKGRALVSQKLTIDRDFDLISVKARAKAAKGKELSAKEAADFKELTEKLDKATEKIDDMQKQIDELNATRFVKKGGLKQFGRMTQQQKSLRLDGLKNRMSVLLEKGCY